MVQSEAPHVRGFLFADLRGFTGFVESHGDRAASDLLTAYRTIVRAAVANFSGAEIRTEGDGFYIVFPSPSSAIRCALAILGEAASSTAAAGGPLPVGIGIHAGETEDSAEGFVGSAVNIAARVCAAANAGELLVTETVRSLVRTSMPLAMEPRGRRHLKGIREPIALFAVRPQGATPLRTRRLRSLTTRMLERRRPTAAFAALAGVAAVATVVLAAALLTNTKAEPGAGRLGGPAPSPSGTAGTTASDPGPFPNVAEQKLLARLDPAIARQCGRAATSDYPRFQAEGRYLYPRALAVQAGLRCTLGASQPDFILLFDMSSGGEGTGPSGTAETYFFRRVGIVRASAGDCAVADLAYQSWSFGILKGRLLCTAGPSRARLDWIYDAENLIATAERDDADRAALYQWWVKTGRGILH